MTSIHQPLVQVRRLRALARVLAFVVLALILANSLLWAVSGPAPGSLRRAELLDPSEYERIGERVAAAEREMFVRGHAGTRPVVVVVGLSTAREDFDAELLGSGICGRAKILNLGSSGGSYRELAFYLQTLRATRMRSALTIVGVHPVWLAGREESGEVEVSSAAPLARSARRTTREALRELSRRWIWLYGNRRGMHAVLQNALWQLRERIDDRFAFGTAARFPDAGVSPWEPRTVYSGGRAPPELLNEQMRAWYGFGWFDSSRYTVGGTEAASLRLVAEEVGSLDGPVMFVMLPEHSALRNRMPSNAMSTFQAILQHAGSAPVLDLRNALPDAGFFDYAHANSFGRARLSLVVARRTSAVARCDVSAGSRR